MKTRIEYLKASADDKNVFISKLVHALSNDDDAFREAAYIVRSAEICGLYNNVKFGAEVYQDEPELITG